MQEPLKVRVAERKARERYAVLKKREVEWESKIEKLGKENNEWEESIWSQLGGKTDNSLEEELQKKE